MAAARTKTRSGEAGEEVRAILEEARDKHGGAVALGYALKAAGIVGERGEAYSESAISNWIKGRARPPADVLLVAAKLARISVDEYLYPEEAGRTDKEDRERLARLEARHEQDIKELKESMRLELLELRKELVALGLIGRGHVSTQLDEGQAPG